MNKNELPVPILAVGLAAAFVFVSAMVLLTRQPKWIQRKLRIGALLLGLTAVAGCESAQPTCYEVVAVTGFELEKQFEGSTVTVDRKKTQTVTGVLRSRTSSAYSYRLKEKPLHGTGGEEFARADITALDRAFDEDVEEFSIALPKMLSPGKYTLELFDQAADKQSYASATFTLEIL
jgi:hypothetical protein